MVAAGLFEEVERVFAARRLPHRARQAIGYKEAAAALAGELTPRPRPSTPIKRESRRYAKRQLTWLRKRRPDALWIRWAAEPDFAGAQRGIRQPFSPHTV